jgi:hypothetical protein
MNKKADTFISTTTTNQNEKTEKVVEYINTLNYVAIKFQEDLIINLDETSFYLDSTPLTTIDMIGNAC